MSASATSPTLLAAAAREVQNGRLKGRQAREAAIASCVAFALGAGIWVWWWQVTALAFVVLVCAFWRSGLGGCGLLGFAFIIVAVRELLGYSPAVGMYLFRGLAILAVVICLGFLAHRLWKSARVVTCPKCRNRHSVYADNSRSLCPTCRTLFVLGPNPRKAINFDSCPYCRLRTAVSADAEVFLCSDCGIPRGPNVRTAPPAVDCPSCQNPVPTQAIYCARCGEPQADLQADGKLRREFDTDWFAGKSPQGHLHFVRAALAGIRRRLLAANSLHAVSSELNDFALALRSLEEALAAPETSAAALARLPEFDRVYLALLEGQQAFLNANEPEHEYPLSELAALADRPHRKPRQAVEDRLKGRLEESSLAWSPEVLSVATMSREEPNRNRTFYRVVQGREKLGPEIARLSAKVQQARSAATP